jgi:hypothetical protein
LAAVLQGIGLSLIFVPLTTISMDPVPRERMGNATSLFNLMRNLGGSIGIAVTGTMLGRYQQAYFNRLGSHVTPYSAEAQRLLDSRYQGSWRPGPIRSRPRSAPTPQFSASCSGRRPCSRSSISSEGWASSSCACCHLFC